MFSRTCPTGRNPRGQESELVDMVNYPVGDFLIRIKNATLAGKREFELPKTKMIKAVAQVLKKEGFLESCLEKKGNLLIKLAYKKKKPVIFGLKLISRPGLRIYIRADELAQKKGMSVFILSTCKGVVSSREALKLRVGGELIAELK